MTPQSRVHTRIFRRHALVETYSDEASALIADPEHERLTDEAKISWNRSLIADYERGKAHKLRKEAVREASYRPFTRMTAYFDRGLNDMVYKLPRFFPTSKHPNVGIYSLNPGAEKPFSVLMTDAIPDLALYGSNAGQFFARWTWEPTGETDGGLDFDADPGEVVSGFRRVDNITDTALRRFREAYPSTDISKDDVFFYIYGLLHSPEYRFTYAADLKRMLPRLPFAADFQSYVLAGRALSDLHVGYEDTEPYPLYETVTGDEHGLDTFRVQKMVFGKGPRVDGRVTADRSTIVYNSQITLTGIPEDAYRYMLGSRSAIEWIMERYQVKTDKASGIVNDPNSWATEHDQPRYVLDLLKRIITVSVRTNEIVDELPPLDLAPKP